jgi:hypothetical protein
MAAYVPDKGDFITILSIHNLVMNKKAGDQLLLLATFFSIVRLD